MAIQIKAALAIECLAEGNEPVQAEFIELDATKALLRLLKVGRIYNAIFELSYQHLFRA